MGRKVTPPPHLRATLQRVFGAGVDAVEIVEHSWWVRLHGRAQATTRRRRIYLRGSASDFFEDPVLLLHEYCHVLHPAQLAARPGERAPEPVRGPSVDSVPTVRPA